MYINLTSYLPQKGKKRGGGKSSWWWKDIYAKILQTLIAPSLVPELCSHLSYSNTPNKRR